MKSSSATLLWVLAWVFAIPGMTNFAIGYNDPSMLMASLPLLAIAAGFAYAAKRQAKQIKYTNSSAHQTSQSNQPTKPTGFICKECGTVNSNVIEEGGRSVAVFVLLLFFGIIPGLLYWVIKSPKKKRICNGCGNKDSLIPIESPLGKKLANEWLKIEAASAA